MIKTTIFENIGFGPYSTDTITVEERFDDSEKSVSVIVHEYDGKKFITRGRSYCASLEEALKEAIPDVKTRTFIRAHLVETHQA